MKPYITLIGLLGLLVVVQGVANHRDFRAQVQEDLKAIRRDLGAVSSASARKVDGKLDALLGTLARKELPKLNEPCNDGQSVCSLKESCGEAGYWAGKCHGNGYCCKPKGQPTRQSCIPKCSRCADSDSSVRRAQCEMYALPLVKVYCNANVGRALGITNWGNAHSPCEARIFAGQGIGPVESACAAKCAGSSRHGSGKGDVKYGANAEECKKCLYASCRKPCIAKEADYKACLAEKKAGILFDDACAKRCNDLCMSGGQAGAAPVKPVQSDTTKKNIKGYTFTISKHGYIVGMERGFAKFEPPFSARRVKCYLNYEDYEQIKACKSGAELADKANRDQAHFKSPGPKGLCHMDCAKYQKKHTAACVKGCAVGFARDATAAAGSGDLSP